MSHKRVAIIDMGTNTFHLLMATWSEEKVNIFYKEKFSVKIGQGGISRGFITEEAFDRAIHALVRFKQTITQYEITEIYAAATSAVRNASNGKELVHEIMVQTGIRVQVISGEKEAELIYRGVKYALDLGIGNSLVMDIGGGSVEFILCNAEKVFWKGSFEIGAQRLLDLFHTTEPISKESAARLINYLDDKLSPLFEVAIQYRPLTLIGSSGSFDTYCEIDIYEKELVMDLEEEKEYSLPINTFEIMCHDIVSKDRQDRMKIPGMIEMRVDMIVVACLLTSHIIKRLSIQNIRVSTYALKEGILSKVIGEEKV